MAEKRVQLLDAFGRPINLQALKEEQAAPTMGSVRRHDAMHPAAGLTPGRLASILRESIENNPEAYLALAEDMEERDLHYASVLSTRKLQVAGLEITVEAAGEDAESVKHADLVREFIERDAFEIELRDILDAVGKGFSATEICWDSSEGDHRIRALKWRDPRWFEFDRVDGETLRLRDNAGPVELTPFGWVIHHAKAKSGLPIRGGLARGAAWAFLFKSFTIKDWAIFVEAYGQPLRLGKYDAGATNEDKDKLLDAVTSIGTDYAAIVPNGMAIEFIEANLSGSHELYEKRADWLDRQISKLVLGQTATTDAIKGGYAVGKTHDGVRADLERADAKQLAGTLNRDISVPLVALNFGLQKKYPRIKIGRPEEIDVDKLVANVERLVPLGLEVGMATMRDKLGLPDPAAGEKLLQVRRPDVPAAGVGPDGKPLPQAPPPQQSLQQEMSPTDAIDTAVAGTIDDWEPLVGPIVAGLAGRIAAAGSLDEVKQILAERFRDMDLSALTEQLARAAFAARLAGEADEDLA
ncbi:DUF935 domain-containing protein [Mesorhizobium sp. J428]|uniref:DUF935 domain-containing protein n=1 Tax=Mesorhizobium sp. J428 TaxID=2898440 RepID=UPI002151691A|nr:DUF935 domain-containing protein [Mesorhizobium sp. J428]MCR5855985.1 DUF935 domain-containing protein [Mesorhizobium sp. J428]